MKRRILVADDEQHFRFSVTLALRRRGLEVTEASGVHDALSRLVLADEEGCPFDLLVTDLQMSPGGGLELIDALRRRGLRMPVLVLSGHLDEKTLGQLAERGCADWLEKPVALDELTGRIEGILDGDAAALAGGGGQGRKA